MTDMISESIQRYHSHGKDLWQSDSCTQVYLNVNQERTIMV
jgi:hypothetical protein